MSKKIYKPNPLRVLIATLKYTKSNFLKLYLLSSMVIVPAATLRAVQLDSTTDASLLASFAGFFVCLAIYRFYDQTASAKKDKVSAIYVLASARILPYMLAAILFSLLLLPMIIGLVLTIIAIGGIAPLWVVLPGLVVLIGGVYIALRSSLATTICALEPASAVTALRASWMITKKRLARLLLCWCLVFFVLLAMSSGIIWVITRIGALANNDLALALVNGVVLALLLPVLIGFATQLYRELDSESA